MFLCPPVSKGRIINIDFNCGGRDYVISDDKTPRSDHTRFIQISGSVFAMPVRFVSSSRYTIRIRAATMM